MYIVGLQHEFKAILMTCSKRSMTRTVNVKFERKYVIYWWVECATLQLGKCWEICAINMITPTTVRGDVMPRVKDVRG
jgi:hypothetical protein